MTDLSNSGDTVNIFLVDDDEDDHGLFAEALKELKIKTNLVSLFDGEELMKHLDVAGNRKPDIVFLDINMPRKNGIECLEEIKSSKELQQIAVVMYSTTSNPSYIEKCYEGGADMYLVKPYGFENLITALDHVASMDWKHYKTVLSKENFVLTY